jgi:hypothetical protein
MTPINRPWQSEGIDPNDNDILNEKVKELNHTILEVATKIAKQGTGSVDEMIQNRFFLTLSVMSHLAEGTTRTHNSAMKRFMASLKDPDRYT